ncbi:nucleotide-diphospho-sugar transferase [Abortiporus biennis]|nr:nucleotide-diphospho-sugar transferase [Abortiporus biennis]
MAFFRRRTVYVFLCLLATILVGTVLVLSSITYYLSIDPAAYLTEQEVDAPLDGPRWNASEHGKVERIPRIIHQTWKTETLPDRWVDVAQGCKDMNPDYEYMLWTDASSRDFIAENYPWFLNTFDGYTYPIQRADAIRYFILYHYGGVYIDLDIGCVRPLDPLLAYPVILPRTIPVGVSNDLMFAEKGHPFMAQTIHNLVTFDHSWVLNYPTVMFSTGPMFLSAQYGIYTASHPPTKDVPGGEVRILPKSLYGKNAKPEEAPHTFFSHYYGSSWHADDAAFIGFLGKWGKALMWVGLAVLLIGVIRLALAPHSKQRRYSLRRIGGYEVMMPRWKTHNGRWYLDLGWFTLPASGTSTQPASPISLSSDDDDDVGMLPISLDNSGALSPTPSEASSFGESTSSSFGRPIVDAMRRAGSSMRAYITGNPEYTALSSYPRRRRSRGVLFFLPAFFSPAQGVQLPTDRLPADRSLSRSRSRDASSYPPDKQDQLSEFEDAGLVPVSDPTIHNRAGSSSGSDSATLC